MQKGICKYASWNTAYKLMKLHIFAIKNEITYFMEPFTHQVFCALEKYSFATKTAHAFTIG